VRAAAQVDEPPVAVERDRLAFRDVLEALDLEGFAHLAEQALGLLAGDLGALEAAPFGEDLAHRHFDPLQVLRGEGAGEAEVVLELLRMVLAAGVDLDLGPQALHGVGEDVLGAMAHELAGLGALDGEDPERAALAQRQAQVDLAAVELGADGVLGQTGADRGGDLERRGPGRHLADGAIGKGELDDLSHRSTRLHSIYNKEKLTLAGFIRSKRPTGQGVMCGGRIGRRWRTRTADLYRVKVAL
jgi:hypothetical protein